MALVSGRTGFWSSLPCPNESTANTENAGASATGRWRGAGIERSLRRHAVQPAARATGGQGEEVFHIGSFDTSRCC